MTDLTYAVVKAAARKGELLTNQQLNDLASSRDIKEFVSRVKDRYPVLAASQMPKLKELEEGLLQTFKTDVIEFVKAAPDAKELLQLIEKELEEENATDLLKWKLGVLDQSKLENMPKKMTKEDAVSLIAKMGFKEESEDATKLFEKYNAPGLIDSIFTRNRLIKITEVIQNNDYEGLVKYLKLKIDL
ncbi:MAG: V-type ATPase subunit, partial [Candidatus Methanomethylicus sp.]|nr:V-type ATPase subunit [Candidatus Methanomethylicus sp.]